MPHAVLGVLVGISALVGVAGSLSYPVFRRKFGLRRTGLLGMFLLVSCSSLAIFSIFLPGSPLDLKSMTNDVPKIILENVNSTTSVDLSSPAEKHWMDVAFWLPFSSVMVLLSGIILARYLHSNTNKDI